MDKVKAIQRLNEAELRDNVSYVCIQTALLVHHYQEASWHRRYKNSAYVYAGGIPYQLNEGDVLMVFSQVCKFVSALSCQYGEIFDINMIRDKKTGKSKGFAFIGYEDQRSTVLAIDNLNGSKLLDMTIRVDHVDDYKPPKDDEDEEADKSGDEKQPDGKRTAERRRGDYDNRRPRERSRSRSRERRDYREGGDRDRRGDDRSVSDRGFRDRRDDERERRDDKGYSNDRERRDDRNRRDGRDT